MNFVALKMLTGDRAKYLGLVFTIAFCTFLLENQTSILAGILMFVVPGASALALVWLVASYAILFGILTIGFAFRLRRLRV